MGIELWGSQRKQLSRAPSKKASTSKGNSSRDNKGKATKVPKPYDSSKFVSWKAQELFKTKSSKKPLMEKRIDVDALMGDCPEVYEELIRRK
ncbi:hypothetical protein RND71_013882 [Anisodus tanguticus]|uniref:Uncharacterized protein n=1 Tax=Anisodus tanguticus TaxID=243964 RepID=A0AAE1SAU7_9SOLA|nr:hypothetical protein RND71_013882 [Anisodus tanguticus]